MKIKYYNHTVCLEDYDPEYNAVGELSDGHPDPNQEHTWESERDLIDWNMNWIEGLYKEMWRLTSLCDTKKAIWKAYTSWQDAIHYTQEIVNHIRDVTASRDPDYKEDNPELKEINDWYTMCQKCMKQTTFYMQDETNCGTWYCSVCKHMKT